MTHPPVGVLLKEWRGRRRRSQMDLAHEVGVSPRHLSFVETGRARPSAELLIDLAAHLDVPLRERNALLLAAGYAPRYGQRPLDDPAMATVRASLQRLLDAHDPYPGVVIDRQWNVVAANAAARLLTLGLPAHVVEPPLNVYRVCLHPDGLARRTLNLPEWAGSLLGQLRRTAVMTGDPQVAALLGEVAAYPDVEGLASAPTAARDDRPRAAEQVRARPQPGGPQPDPAHPPLAGPDRDGERQQRPEQDHPQRAQDHEVAPDRVQPADQHVGQPGHDRGRADDPDAGHGRPWAFGHALRSSRSAGARAAPASQ